jgi:hypothetical protein
MTEVFENLLPEVNVKQRRGKPYLTIESINPSINIYPPLLLVDQIPVFDLDAFLAINPLKIKQIELVKEVFVRGNMMFGGIISLITRKGDMAGVDLPAGSYFFDYVGFHPGPDDSLPGETTPDDRIPDTRNTLLWMDDLDLSDNGSGSVQFNASTSKGEYLILVRGVSGDGNILVGEGRFEVR